MPLSSDAPKRIAIVDDDPEVRESYAWTIEDDTIEPVVQDGPLGSLQHFLECRREYDGALSDHKLRTTDYATFDGADLVMKWYQLNFPAVLCTTFSSSRDDLFRARRRWIPVVLSPEELDVDRFQESLELVTREIRGEFVPARRPWRALVHFVDYSSETNTAYAVAPAWSTETVSLRLKDLPDGLAKRIARGEDVRTHATANLGAELNADLYLCDWEKP